MGLNDRLFTPPTQDTRKIEARLARLPGEIRAWILSAGDALAGGDLNMAQKLLSRALALAPAQPDVLRLHGLLLARCGNLSAAYASFESALGVMPDDAMIYWQYAQVLEEAGDIEGAANVRMTAVQRIPGSPLAWADLGEHFVQYATTESAIEPLARAACMAPDYAPVHLKLGAALVNCGRTQEGAAAIRQALVREPAFGAAWMSLANIKTVPITDDELAQMRELLRRKDLDTHEQTAIEYALAQSCEDRSEYREAYDLLLDANARRRRELPPWSMSDFLERLARSEAMFDTLQPAIPDQHFGAEAIFIVGMPRSGSTLMERIIASHSQVEAAGELDAMTHVLTKESAHRRQFYPDWVPQATPDDWKRLGQTYLDMTERWRTTHPRFTDKMPNNWLFLGAIRAMLPGARIVVARRDPLENCWSCFKQYFQNGWPFTCDQQELARYWLAFDHTASTWSRQTPSHIREQSYEELTEHAEEEVRALLAFCGLPFEEACLRFHESQGVVRTISAAQVRQPLRKSVSRAARYGALLDPLRAALGMPATDSCVPQDATNAERVSMQASPSCR